MKKWMSILLLAFLAAGIASLRAVEIPLESLTPARIGYIDMQKVFDTYPEKSFAEGDLLREVEKRKRELNQRQSLIKTLKEQIAADENPLSQGRGGAAVPDPMNNVPDQTPAAPAAAPVSQSTFTVIGSSTTAVEPYPLEDPLAGLPGHNASTIVERVSGSSKLPGMKAEPTKKGTLLD